MGKYGFRSGYVEAQNMDAGSFTLNGDGSDVTVSLDEAMLGTPVINFTPAEDASGLDVYVSSVSKSDFTVSVAGDGTNDDEQEFNYLALDPDRRD